MAAPLDCKHMPAENSNRGFSIVMPLYNKRDFVRRAVDSVLSQSFEAFELIVVDDGSTDGGAELLGDMVDSRLRIVTQANAGVAAARNRGIADASYDRVAFLDADDWWRPTHLAELDTIASARPDAGIVATRVRQVRGAVGADAENDGPRHIREIDYFDEAAADILIVHTSATALRRDLVCAVGGFRHVRPGQDIDCWSRMALIAPVVVSDRQTAFYARDTGGTMTSWATEKWTRDDIATLAEFGGAVESLAEALASGRYEGRRAGIERYIDARILSGARKCVMTGDMANARRRLAFIHRKSSREYLAYRALANLPGRPFARIVALLKRRRDRGRQTAVLAERP